MQELKECEWFPAELNTVVYTLLSFREIQDACFGWDLKEDWKEKIEIFTSKFKDLQAYSRARLELNLTVTWKIHSICCHLSTFLSRQECGMARFAEQTGEAVHARIKPIMGCHKRKINHPEHGARQQRGVVEFSSSNK